MPRRNAFSSIFRWASAALGAPCLATAALAAPLCLDTATQAPAPPRALAMAAFAVQEHAAFGGQSMDAQGRMTEAGDAEAEDVRRAGSDLAPWQRVLGYWQAVDALPPALARFAPVPSDDVPASTAADVRAQAALARVAVIDTPWSAAFVSWLARQAGLADGEFVFSEAHVDYAGAAWQAGLDDAAGRPTRHALRACDLLRTPPRVGDLVCQARGAGAGLDTFDKIGEVLATRDTGGAPLPMHCDVVVAVDAAGFDTVGGNLLQSVTRRRLAFAPGTRLLDASYLPGGCAPAQAPMPGAAGCLDRHMSRQPWSLLLQWR
uniref:DUF2272 domain-containing protein n=1 Tax=unclassified Variovorax TaxID=663243 RepID=UPI0040393213